MPLLLHCCSAVLANCCEGGHIHRLAVINDTGAWSLKKCKFMHEAEQNGPLCSAEAGWHFLKWCNVFSCVMISLSFFLTCRYSIQGKKRKQQMHLDSEIYSLSLQQVCWVEGTIVCLFFYDQWTFWGVIKKNFNLLYHTPRLDLSFSDWHVSLTAGRKPPAHVLCNVCQCHCWTFGQSKGGRGTY